MLTQRLFEHALKKHNMTIPQYAEKYNIDLYKYQKEGGYYKNGLSRKATRNHQKYIIRDKQKNKQK